MTSQPAQAPAGSNAQDGSDPRCVPMKLSAPIPVGDEIAYPNYSEEDQEVWRLLCARQEKLLPGRAAGEFLTGLKALALDRDRIPSLADVSRKLQAGTGWRIARTPGLLDAHDFFSHLARRIFPCTDFYQKVGRAALNCRDPIVEESLTRIYWFTVEFGLVRNPEGLRIYGNGIISSFAETQFSLTGQARKRPFIADEVARQPYDIWHLQGELFVVESFEELESSFDDWAARNALA